MPLSNKVPGEGLQGRATKRASMSPARCTAMRVPVPPMLTCHQMSTASTGLMRSKKGNGRVTKRLFFDRMRLNKTIDLSRKKRYMKYTEAIQNCLKERGIEKEDPRLRDWQKVFAQVKDPQRQTRATLHSDVHVVISIGSNALKPRVRTGHSAMGSRTK
jgi:hypothetical protein